MKMLEYGTYISLLDRSDSETVWSEDGPLERRSKSAKRAIKSVEQELRRSTRQKNPVMRFRHNEYMAHHYAYVTRVAEVCEPESYVEAAKDANWRAVMEEEMHTLVENETWDLVDAPKSVKVIG